MKRIQRWTWAAIAVLTSWVAVGAALAQEGYPTDQGTSAAAGTETWYTQPWAWIVGVAVLLIVVIALKNRGGRTRF